MKIGFTGRARKDAENLEPNIQKRIRIKLEWYISQEEPLVFADKLTDHELGEYRYRIGDYRVIFDLIADDVIRVNRIGHRKEIYR